VRSSMVKDDGSRKATYRIAVLLFAVASALAARAQQVQAPVVQAVRIDGTSLTGEWLGSDSRNSIRIRAQAGEEVRLVIDELSSVQFDTRTAPPTDGAVIHLADGGRLFGELVGGEGDAILVRTAISKSLRLPFRVVAGVRLVQGDEHAKSAELFDSSLESRLPGQDVLVTRGPEEVKSLRGRLEELDAERGSFVFGDRPRVFQNEKLYGIVFAAGVAKDTAYTMTAYLADGSSFSGELEEADAQVLRVKASFESMVELPVSTVAKLSIRSPRVVYLSDLTTTSQRVEGVVHRPWPVRKDRAVSARALSIDGRVFDKGLGVHSLTELVFNIAGAYESFAATIGIDDVVRPLGSVVFRVSGDGRELFDSGEVRGLDEPRDVRVDVSGVRSLTLTVDYGKGA